MIAITLAQLNPTVGDIEGNVERMIQAAQRAWAAGAALVVFPELSLTGYHPGDLLDDASFLQRCEAGLAALKHASRQIPQLAWVIGAPIPREGPGKNLSNALLVVQGGSDAFIGVIGKPKTPVSLRAKSRWAVEGLLLIEMNPFYQRGRTRFQLGSTCCRISASSSRLR